jgi:hypothetical protein
MMNLEERRNQLTAMKRTELRNLAKEYGVSASGVKEAIVERIVNHESQTTDKDDSLSKIDRIISSIKEMTNEEKVEVINQISGNPKTIESIIKTVANTELARLMCEANINVVDLAHDGDKGVNFLKGLHDIATLYATHDYTNTIIHYFIDVLRHRLKDMQEEEIIKEYDESIKNETGINKLVTEMNMKDGQPFVYKHVVDRPLLQQIMLNVCRDLYLDSQRAIKAANGDKTVKQFGPVYVGKKHSGLHMKDAMAKSTVKTAAEKVLNKEQQKKYIVLNPGTKHTEFKQAVQILDKLDSAGLITGEKTDKDYAKFYSVHPEKILAFLDAVGCLKK